MKEFSRHVVLALLVLSTFYGCIEPTGQFDAIPPGPWRGTLQLSSPSLTDRAFDERSNGILPFNFDVIYDPDGGFYIQIKNGEERIKLDEIAFGRDLYIQKDTIRIEFPAYGTYISAKYEEDAIEGMWYAPDRGKDYAIPFRALHGEDKRFVRIDTPVTDISGKWAVTFEVEKDKPYDAVGIFDQDENGIVTGTFRTATGDYRFLEGKMSGNRLFLSVFDGAHAFLFEAKYLEDGTLSGIFRSGNHYKTYWVARRDPQAELPDPFEQAVLVDDAPPLSFSLPNTEGDTISLDDPGYDGKPKLIQIMGTWCPNCRDETEFLVEYLSAHPKQDLEVFTLAFERYDTYEAALPALRRYKAHMGIKHHLLYAGPASKEEATNTIGVLEEVVSFPTLLFLDGKNNVTRIHTGFNGPATDEYDAFIEKFEQEINRITAD